MLKWSPRGAISRLAPCVCTEWRPGPILKGADGDKGGSVGAKSRFPESTTAMLPVLPDPSRGYGGVLVAAMLAVFVVAWAATNLFFGGEGFAVLVSDKVVGGEEAASALARLFAALVLGLFLADAVGWRARWVAGDWSSWAWDTSYSGTWSR